MQPSEVLSNVCCGEPSGHLSLSSVSLRVFPETWVLPAHLEPE